MQFKFWIEDEFRTEPNEIQLDFQLAEMFLEKSKHLVLEGNEGVILASRGTLARDFIRLGNEKSVTELQEGLEGNEKRTFELNVLRGRASKDSVQNLEELLPYKEDWGNAILGRRLLKDGNQDTFFKKIKFEQLQFDTQKEIVTMLSHHTDNIQHVIELLNFSKKNKPDDESSFGLIYMISKLIIEGQLSFKDGLAHLKETNLYNDNSMFRIATKIGAHGDMEMYSEALNHIKSESKKQWSLSNIANASTYLKFDSKQQADFIKILESIKLSKELKCYLVLFKEYFNDNFQLSNSLYDYCNKNKGKQLDDVVHGYLIHNNRITESIEFIDKTKGRNRFNHYERSLKYLLEKGEYQFVIDKAKTLRDNSIRSGIIEKLCELNEIDLATKVYKEFFRTKELRRNYIRPFIKFHTKTKNIEKAIELIEEQETKVRQAAFYHNIGRYLMGIQYDNSTS